MITVTVSSPRFKRASRKDFSPATLVGDAADRLAEQHLYASGDHTLAYDGRVLDRREKLGELVPHKARVELVIR